MQIIDTTMNMVEFSIRTKNEVLNYFNAQKNLSYHDEKFIYDL